jgi:calcium/proton exchanger cax
VEPAESHHGDELSLGFCPLPGPDAPATFESGAIGNFFCEDHTHFEAAGATLGLGDVFMGVVVLALVGNAAENSTAIQMAMRNQMDLALAIAVGSSMQIAIFVAPLLVFRDT